MLKRIAAALLAVGLVLPFGCGVRPLMGAWDTVASSLMIGIPVLVTIAYVLHTFVPALARFHERNGPAFHGLFRVVYFVLAGMYLHDGLAGDSDGWVFWVAALAVTGAVLYWSQGRGTKAQRLPLLLLMVVGLPAINYFASALDSGDLEVGGVVVIAGWVLGVVGEVGGLRATPRVSHGG